MSKEDTIKMDGMVTDILPNNMFKVELKDNKIEIIAYLSGKMKQNRIKVIRGDTVEVEMTPYDLTKGRISFRYKN